MNSELEKRVKIIMKIEWISDFVTHQLHDGTINVFITLDFKDNDDFNIMLDEKLYKATISIRKNETLICEGISALCRKLPPTNNIDGSVSRDVFVIDFFDPKIERKHLYEAEISIDVGDFVESKHYLRNIKAVR